MALYQVCISHHSYLKRSLNNRFFGLCTNTAVSKLPSFTSSDYRPSDPCVATHVKALSRRTSPPSKLFNRSSVGDEYEDSPHAIFFLPCSLKMHVLHWTYTALTPKLGRPLSRKITGPAPFLQVHSLAVIYRSPFALSRLIDFLVHSLPMLTFRVNFLDPSIL